MGTAFGASRPSKIMSAFLPTSREPISFSIWRARAPSMVAISTTAFAPSARGSILVIFWSFAARSISSIKFKSLLLPAGLSVPRPTTMPAARSSITGATPLANIMLREGVCTELTWRCARSLRSASSTQVQCAAHSGRLRFFGDGILEVVHVGERGDAAADLFGCGEPSAPAHKILVYVFRFGRKNGFCQPFFQRHVIFQTPE